MKDSEDGDVGGAADQDRRHERNNTEEEEIVEAGNTEEWCG